MIKFITGNKDKFSEIKDIVPELEQVHLDLPEIQEIDAKKIITNKLQEALKHQSGRYIVEDTSLYLDCLNGKLPGPLIKWFEQGIGNEGLVDLTHSYGNNKAVAKTLIGYAASEKEIYFFEGGLAGEIVPQKGDLDFGWGPIFKPEGSAKTFGEMSREEKHRISMRGIAARKFKEFLEKQ